MRPLKERLLEKLVPGPGGCWIWIGARRKDGYGVIKDSGVRKSTHRLSYELHIGPIEPLDSYVAHRCDVPACCRPDHLFLATPQDNQRDRIAKGRGAIRGSNSGNSKLVEADVHDIRRRLKAGETLTSIAREKKMSSKSIRDIKAGRNWGWLPEEG